MWRHEAFTSENSRYCIEKVSDVWLSLRTREVCAGFPFLPFYVIGFISPFYICDCINLILGHWYIIACQINTEVFVALFNWWLFMQVSPSTAWSSRVSAVLKTRWLPVAWNPSSMEQWKMGKPGPDPQRAPQRWRRWDWNWMIGHCLLSLPKDVPFFPSELYPQLWGLDILKQA